MADRPNILLITSDQHRGDSLGCAGHPCVETPHLDSLAYDGVRFDRAYVDCPVCIPARTALITGRQAHRYGRPSYSDEYRIDHPCDQFLGSLVTAAGYQTELVGKTHWHTEEDFRGGFEHVTWLAGLRRQRLIETGQGTEREGIGYNEIKAGRSDYPPHLHATNWITERCLDFLDTRERAQPFFLWASYTAPHPPFLVDEPFYSRYLNSDIPEAQVPDWVGTDTEPRAFYTHRLSWNPKPHSAEEIRFGRAAYYGLISHLDQQLGRLLSKLMVDGDLANTWIIYTSDHGEHLGDYGMIGKSAFTDSAARVPLIIRPPQAESVARGQVSGALAEWVDLLPTLCDVAGTAPADGVDGHSLLPLLRGETETVHDQLHGQINDSHMLLRGDLKYLYFADDGSELLFDLGNDPDEQHPVTDDRLATMRAALREHLEAEGNAHAANGALVNQGLPKPPAEELRAKSIFARGLPPLAALQNLGRSSRWVH